MTRIDRRSPATVLVPTDFTPASDMALSYAARLARWYEAKLYLAHVLEIPTEPFLAPSVTSRMTERARQEAHYGMRHVAAQADRAGARYELILEEGDVAEAIQRIVGERGLDLAVVATRGRRGIGRYLLGSSAEDIFRLAGCPVFLLGPVARAVTTPAIRRILCATDLSDDARSAEAWALSLALEHQAELCLAHVLEGNANGDRCGAVRDRLGASVPPDVRLWCRPSVVVVPGRVPGSILDQAARMESDLIVLGGPLGWDRRRPCPRPCRGTTTEIVSRAPCPVLSARLRQSVTVAEAA